MGMSYHFADKVSIVTGGGSGIGRALCHALGERGADVIVADVDAETAELVASEVSAAGGRASAAVVDTTIAASVEELVDRTATGHGRLDFMFNNAGLGFEGETRDSTSEHWRRVIDVNLMGVVHGTLAAYKVMVEQGAGHIVNTGSAAGLTSLPLAGPYTASKHAVVGLSTSLRYEAETLGVRVSVACPGYVRTPIYERRDSLEVDRDAANALIRFKMLEPAQAALAILAGVERNRGIITFPLYARLLWWVSRVQPALLNPVGRKMVRDFRALRG